MAKDPGKQIKNDSRYEALKEKGYSMEKAAKIANSGRKASTKGGTKSH